MGKTRNVSRRGLFLNAAAAGVAPGTLAAQRCGAWLVLKNILRRIDQEPGTKAMGKPFRIDHALNLP
jgi:hypothetical protein